MSGGRVSDSRGFLVGLLPDTVGLGLFWVWKNAIATFVAGSDSVAEPLRAYLQCLPYLGPLLATLIMVILVRRGRTRVASLPVFVAFSCGAAIGTLLLVIGARLWPVPVLGVIEVATFGLGTVVAALWGARVVERDPRGAVNCIVLSFCLSSAVYLLFSLFEPVSQTLLPLVLVLSAACFGKGATPGEPAFPASSAVSGLSRGDVVSLGLLIFLIGLSELLRVVLTGLFAGDAAIVSLFTQVTQLGCLAVFGVVFLFTRIFARRTQRDVTVAALARFLLPLLMLGYMSLLLYSRSGAAHAVLGAGYWSLYCLAWLFAGNVARAAKAPALVFAATEGGIGLVAFIVLVATNVLGADGTALIPSVAVSVLVAVAVFALLPGGGDWRIGRVPDASRAPECAPDPEPAAAADPVGRVSEAFGLSPREAEVLSLLAKGRSTPYIQNHLGVAFGTAQAHVRHVYEKTGVHSRQELLDLIEGFGDGSENRGEEEYKPFPQ